MNLSLKVYLALIVLLNLMFINNSFSQSTETFEDETPASTTFTDDGQQFDIISSGDDTYDVVYFEDFGWNGSSTDDQFIDNTQSVTNTNDGTNFAIQSNDGSDFVVIDLYLFVSNTDEDPHTSGSLTITGRRNGSEVYTFTKSSGFSDVSALTPNNGFTYIDFATEGSSDYSGTAIDELIFSTTGDMDYLALDAFQWNSVPEASDGRILAESGTDYIFEPADFGTTESDYSIKIESLPGKGSLKLDGNNVSAGDEIPVSSIKNDLLTWSDNSDGYGYGYTNFDFKVIDDTDVESAEPYTLSFDVGIRTVQFTDGRGWRFLSSPSSNDDYASVFTGVTVDLPPAEYPSLYVLDQQNYEWNPVQNLSSSTERGEGFIFYQKEGAGPADLSFEGNWNDLSDLFEYSDLGYDGTGESSNPGNFYLVGNPHPIALDFCEFDLSHVSETITFWDPETGAGDYISKSCDIEDEIEIVPFQSFWIRTTDANPTASIPEESYLNSDADGYFKENSSDEYDQPLITLNLSSEDNIFTNQLQILFSENGEDGLDPMDAPKLSASELTSNWLSFYSLDTASEKYAIQALPNTGARFIEDKPVFEIPLHVETTEDGFFKMSWTLTDLDADIYLKDNATGNEIDLNKQRQYSFMQKPTAKATGAVQILERLSSTLFKETEQNPRFTLVVDYGVHNQNEPDNDLPEAFTLQQNYPNPFNPVTVIQFQLANQSNVELSVYDMTGRQVATLVNKPMQAGSHQVNFNAQHLSSGVYIYTLKAGPQMLSRKLAIVK